MSKDYTIVDDWNLKGRKRLNKDGIDLLHTKLLSDVDRYLHSNIKRANENKQIFVAELLRHLKHDIKRMISWRFIGDEE